MVPIRVGRCDYGDRAGSARPVFGPGIEADDQTGASGGANSLEPLAPVASLARAAAFLDETALAWTEQKRCGSCHTNYPYLVARPTLKDPGSADSIAVRRFFEDRVAHWDDPIKVRQPRWDTEVIATAWALSLNDALSQGKLHPLTRKALDRVWTLQKPHGGFDWLKCDWPPLEHDDYYGAIVAAIGAGYAPEDYAKGPAAKAGIDRLRAYFAANSPPDLHHETMLLWASSRLDGLMTSQQRDDTIGKLRKLQRTDGGWSLPALGSWKRRDGSSNDPQSPSDGYATGLVIFVLRQTGIPAHRFRASAGRRMAARQSTRVGTLVYAFAQQRQATLHRPRGNSFRCPGLMRLPAAFRRSPISPGER